MEGYQRRVIEGRYRRQELYQKNKTAIKKVKDRCRRFQKWSMVKKTMMIDEARVPRIRYFRRSKIGRYQFVMAAHS